MNIGASEKQLGSPDHVGPSKTGLAIRALMAIMAWILLLLALSSAVPQLMVGAFTRFTVGTITWAFATAVLTYMAVIEWRNHLEQRGRIDGGQEELKE